MTMSAVEIIKPAVECNKYPELNRPIISLPLRQSVEEAAKSNEEIRTYLETTPMIESDDKRVLIWADTQQVIDVVSSGFKVLHHSDAVRAALDAIYDISGEEFDWHVDFHGSKRQSVNVVLDAPFMKSVEVRDGAFLAENGDSRQVGDVDLSKLMIKLVNSYGKRKASARLMGERLTCLNGQTMPYELGAYSHKHTWGLSIKELAESFESMARNSQKIAPVFNMWNREVWDNDRILMAAKDLNEMGMPQKHTRLITDMTRANRRTKKWDVYNKATNLATHSSVSVSNRDSMDRIVERYFWDHDALALVA